MSGVPARVAVDVGASGVRVAAADPGGEPYLLAHLPVVATDPLAAARDVLDELLGGRGEELVVVHRCAASPAPEWAALGAVVRAVPGVVAAARGPGVVVDAGRSGAEVAVLDGAGEVTEVRAVPVGGTRLDAAVTGLLPAAVAGLLPAADPAAAQLVREALSLRPSAGGIGADAVRAVLAPVLAELVAAVRAVAVRAAAGDRGTGPGGPGGADRPGGGPGEALPVLLVGGLARTPLLAELLDTAGVGPVTVAPRPDVAAVLGALRLPPAALPVVGGGPAAATASPTPRLPAFPAARRRRFGPRLAVGAVCAVGAVGAGGVLAGLLGGGAPAPVAGVVAQYGYAVALPAGWAHTGGLPERRRTLLTPVDAPDGGDLVVVERTPLGYDAGAEPDRAVAELRAAFDSAAAAGAPLADLAVGARFAGRDATTYREGAVDWYVLFDGPDQFSVGCRHTPTRAAAVRAACATVVGSLRHA